MLANATAGHQRRGGANHELAGDAVDEHEAPAFAQQGEQEPTPTCEMTPRAWGPR